MRTNFASVIQRITLAALGLFVLVPAFVLFANLSVIGNSSSGVAVTNSVPVSWLSFVTLIGAVVFLIALWKLIFARKRCCWCGIWCVGYGFYVSVMIGCAVSDNFIAKLQTSGVLYALLRHDIDIVFVVVPIIFSVLVFLTVAPSRRKTE